MEGAVELRLVPSVTDEAVASEILSMLESEKLVSWQELAKLYRNRGVSLYRLRKILLSLLNKGVVVELPCRLFTTRECLEETPREVLRELVEGKVRSLGLRKCGKPVGAPYEKVSISISRKRGVRVSIR